MLTHFSKTFDQPFVLTEVQLREIVDLLIVRFDNIDLMAHCVDDASRSFDNLDELLSYRNSPSNRILSLNVEADARSLEDRKNIRLQWLRTHDNMSSHMSLTIRADDNLVTELRAHIEKVISETRPSNWYARIATLHERHVLRFLSNILSLVFVTIGVLYLYFTFIDPVIPNKSHTPITMKDLNIITYSVFGFLLVVYIFTLFLRHAIFKPKRTLFPPAVILIQDEIIQTERLEKRRTIIFSSSLTIVITAIATILAIVFS